MEIRKDISPGKDAEEQKCCSLQLSLSKNPSRIREQIQVVSSKMQSGDAQPGPSSAAGHMAAPLSMLLFLPDLHNFPHNKP